MAVVGVTPSVEEFATEQGVDQRRLAGVELADDDEQEELVELTQALGEGPALVGGDIVAFEGRRNLGEQLALVAQEILLFGGRGWCQAWQEFSAPAARTLRI